MDDLKQKVIDAIIEREGGYVDDPQDSGGRTKFGITQRVARAHGYKKEMRHFPRAMAEEIYAKKYWDSLCLDSVVVFSESVAEELADTAVNMGVGRAARFLQRSLNVLNDRERRYADVRVDGQIGPKTMAALRAYFLQRGTEGEAVLYTMLNALQGAFYVTLAERREKDQRFVWGWYKNRVRMGA